MKIHFTYITHCILVGSHYFSLYFWRRVGACLTVGVGISFFIAFALDVTAFDRLAKKQGLYHIMPLWHIGNVVLHVLPFMISCIFESDVKLIHGIVAGMIHIGWIFVQSNGTMYLDEVYIEMKPLHWKLLWKVTLASELLSSIFMSLY